LFCQSHYGARDLRGEGESFTDVNVNGTWDSDMGVAGLGDVVLYTIECEAGAMTGRFASIIGTIRHHATVAVRNEPFER
jgi:hypothetical protein